MYELSISFFLLCIIFVLCFLRYIDIKQTQDFINNFESYSAVLTYHMHKAYDIVYKDKILIYSIEGTKPSNSDIKTYTYDFCHLVIKLIGPRLEKVFYGLYGNEETLYRILTEYFNDRSENDEIRESSINNLMDQGINEK